MARSMEDSVPDHIGRALMRDMTYCCLCQAACGPRITSRDKVAFPASPRLLMVWLPTSKPPEDYIIQSATRLPTEAVVTCRLPCLFAVFWHQTSPKLNCKCRSGPTAGPGCLSGAATP